MRSSGDLAEDLKEANELKKALERQVEELSEPPVAPTDGDGGETGYKESEITVKERLIESLTGEDETQ